MGMILLSTMRLIFCTFITIGFQGETDISLCKLRKLIATIASLSSLSVFSNDLLSSGFANQISSRLGVGTGRRRTPVSIPDSCLRFM